MPTPEKVPCVSNGRCPKTAWGTDDGEGSCEALGAGERSNSSSGSPGNVKGGSAGRSFARLTLSATDELMHHVAAIQRLGDAPRDELQAVKETERAYRSLIKTLKSGNLNLHKEVEALKVNGSPSDVDHEKGRAQAFEAKYRELAKRAKSEIYKLEQVKLKYENDVKMSQDIISDRENEICVVRKELEHAESLTKHLNLKLKETESALESALQDKEILQKALRSSRVTLNGSGGSPREVDRLQREVSKANERERECIKQLERVRTELRDVKHELDDTKTRLSKLMGQKLTDANPNIADLSDRNRPTKLSERYSELYDNQWTDAFETLDKVYADEKETIGRLISILLETSAFCMKQSQRQMARIKSAVIASDDKDLALPIPVSKQLKDCRKAAAETSAQNMIQKYNRQLRQSTSKTARDAVRVKEFLEECFYVCWLMSIQDPPVVLDEDFQSGGRFDSEVYKAYTKSGPTNDFLVWPAMFLHKGGPVLCKGVAQAQEKIQPSREHKLELSRRKTEKPSSHHLPPSAAVRPSSVRSSLKRPESDKLKRFLPKSENASVYNPIVRNGPNDIHSEDDSGINTKLTVRHSSARKIQVAQRLDRNGHQHYLNSQEGEITTVDVDQYCSLLALHNNSYKTVEKIMGKEKFIRCHEYIRNKYG
ncbi:uncharacterized protein LOC128230391 [Mya arenaria]|uniref:uncharacterized protein LOC128230391 n=1 Tax=Mya arenaria TaxID=6604 RepID=UPI0022E7F8B1|nr:uncharacterized protein LOC128230391 [Mya arenaria]